MTTFTDQIEAIQKRREELAPTVVSGGGFLPRDSWALIADIDLLLAWVDQAKFVLEEILAMPIVPTENDEPYRKARALLSEEVKVR